MAFRTVAVELVAKVAQYKREMASAGRSTKDFRQELNDAAKAGEKSAVANEQAARAVKDVGRSADKAGNEFQGMAKDAGLLKKKIAETEAEIQKLTRALDETGNLDLLKSIRKEQGTLRSLRRLLPKEVVEEAVDVGVKTGQKFGEGLTLSLRNIRGPAIALLVGIGVAAAPGIGAAISGAVLGGAGIGGIIGGIVAASQDQRVQEEAKRIGDRFTSALTDTGGPFVDPLIESLRILGDAGDRFANNFAKVGDKLAPVLVPLAQGLAGFADEFMPGLIKAAEAMKPVIRAIANELPKIGREIGDFFTTISEESDGAVLGIVAISQAIRGTIRTMGAFIAGLANMYSASLDVGIAISGVMEKIFGWIPGTGDAIRAGRDALLEQRAALDAAKNSSNDFEGAIQQVRRAEEDVAEATKTATEKIEDQITATDKLFGRFMDSREVARDYQQTIDDLTESVRENGTSLDIGTEAGRANQEALDNLAEKIKDARENTILMTGDVGAANTVYYQQVEALRQQAIRLGLSKQEANNLATELSSIPRQVETEIRAPGLLEALARAREYTRLLGSISSGARARAGDESGYGGGRAGGGSMDPGKWYTVGEDGTEVVSMNASGGGAMVYNSKQTGAMAGAWYGNTIAPMGGAVAPSPTTIIVKLIDPMTGKVMRQAAINDATSRGVAPAAIRAAHP